MASWTVVRVDDSAGTATIVASYTLVDGAEASVEDQWFTLHIDLGAAACPIMKIDVHEPQEDWCKDRRVRSV